MEYSAYLPDIDVEDGKARVMQNMKLYLRLLDKFDGKKMAESVSQAVATGDVVEIVQAAHALRGTAANLGFPVVLLIAEEIEILAKSGKDCEHLLTQLEDAAVSLSASIDSLIDSYEG